LAARAYCAVAKFTVQLSLLVITMQAVRLHSRNSPVDLIRSVRTWRTDRSTTRRRSVNIGVWCGPTVSV